MGLSCKFFRENTQFPHIYTEILIFFADWIVANLFTHLVFWYTKSHQTTYIKTIEECCTTCNCTEECLVEKLSVIAYEIHGTKEEQLTQKNRALYFRNGFSRQKDESAMHYKKRLEHYKLDFIKYSISYSFNENGIYFTIEAPKVIQAVVEQFMFLPAKKRKLEPKREDIYDRLINYWNSIEITPKHRRGSKRYALVRKYLKALMNGTFLTFYGIKEGSFTCLKITNKYQGNYEFTETEIKRVLKQLASLFIEGYVIDGWRPTMKGKSLCTLLYDPYLNFSYFFIVLMNAPKMKTTIKIYDKSKYLSDVNKIVQLLPYKYHDEKSKEFISNGINEIYEYHQRNLKKLGNRTLCNFNSFLGLYRNFISLRCNGILPQFIGNTNCTYWYRFCSFLKQEISVDIHQLK